MTIEALVRGFEDTSLPKACWTHDAHLLVATVYLLQSGPVEATRRMRAGIERYNAVHGGAYHETITLAWIAVLDAFVRARPGQSIEELTPQLRQFGRDYLLRYYSRERLFSAEARRTWVPPDRLPLAEAA